MSHKNHPWKLNISGIPYITKPIEKEVRTSNLTAKDIYGFTKKGKNQN